MINERLKCPKCGKPLLQSYSKCIISITCSCGKTINLRDIKSKEYKNPVKAGMKK